VTNYLGILAKKGINLAFEAMILGSGWLSTLLMLVPGAS